jgi:hypothetical protein
MDLVRKVSQLHDDGADGSVMFHKKLSRPQFSEFDTSRV